MAERILAAMSGGVDSSVAAALLRDQGCEVVGVTMRVWRESDPAVCEGRRTCCSPRDLADARAVAACLDISFYALDLEDVFRERVVEPFVSEYLKGRTPNPCVHCNKDMKLGVLLEKAKAYDCSAVATGHYAIVERTAGGNRWGMRRGRDRAKDQSYYLFSLNQEQLACFRTPLGEWTKTDLRREAERRGLPVAAKRGSQEVCFIPDDDYRRFVREHPLAKECAVEPGEIVDREGRVLGRHGGIMNFTIGQRRGLGISHPAPLYVVGLDAADNRVVVGEKNDVFSRELVASDVNWVSIDRPATVIETRVQIRYRHDAVPARLDPLEGERVRVVFDEAQPAVTPGQAAVFYSTDNEWLLGGGWIETARR